MSQSEQYFAFDETDDSFLVDVSTIDDFDPDSDLSVTVTAYRESADEVLFERRYGIEWDTESLEIPKAEIDASSDEVEFEIQFELSKSPTLSLQQFTVYQLKENPGILALWIVFGGILIAEYGLFLAPFFVLGLIGYFVVPWFAHFR